MIWIQSTEGGLFYAGRILKTKQFVHGKETGKIEIVNYVLTPRSEIGIEEYGILGVYNPERADMILNDIKVAIEEGKVIFEMPQE